MLLACKVEWISNYPCSKNSPADLSLKLPTNLSFSGSFSFTLSSSFSSRCLQLSNNHVPLKLRTCSSHHPEKNISYFFHFSQASSPSSLKKSHLNPRFFNSHLFHSSQLISSYQLPCLLRSSFSLLKLQPPPWRGGCV